MRAGCKGARLWNITRRRGKNGWLHVKTTSTAAEWEGEGVVNYEIMDDENNIFLIN